MTRKKKAGATANSREDSHCVGKWVLSMGKVRGLSRFLLVVTSLAIGSCIAFAQTAASSCSVPTAEISRVSRPTGVLRADPNANDTASQKIASDSTTVCGNLSDPSAFGHVHMKISDNNIILAGTVPTESDEEQLVAIVSNNADGRTIFNRLEVVPLQMASRRR